MKDKIDLTSKGKSPGGVLRDYSNEDTEDYLECVPWNQPEELIVLGGRIIGAPYVWEDFMVPGSAVYAPVSKLVLDVEVDEKIYKLYVKNYSTGAMLFSQAGGQGDLTRADWKKAYGTDALKGMIMKTLNAKITGGGVHPSK